MCLQSSRLSACEVEVEVMDDGNAAHLLPSKRLVQDVIRDQAITRPDAPAISSAHVAYTYAQLDALSSRLADHICSSNAVKPDDIIPILCDKVRKSTLPLLSARLVTKF